MPKTKRATTQDPDRNTLTQSVSFVREIYEFMEVERVKEGVAHQGKPMPRSEYIAVALVEKWKKAGIWPPKAKR